MEDHIEEIEDGNEDSWLYNQGLEILQEDGQGFEDLEDYTEPCQGEQPNGEHDKSASCIDGPSADHTLTLYVGMEFPSEIAAYDFYNHYAMRNGFGVRISCYYRSRKLNCITSRKFVCSKEGKKDLNDKRKMNRDIKRRRETREDCKAFMRIHLSKSGVWIVKDFYDIHSHKPSTPSKVIKLRSHHHLTESSKSLIDSLNQCGMKPSTISKVLNVDSSINETENVTRQSCIDHLKKSRKSIIGRQCISVIKYFQEKNARDSDFFFEIELDEDGMTRNVFWADGRSRASYLKFGDVIVFDVTYKTNVFSMPFAPFTGINHHRQSTLFGCALLSDETELTFIWLFKTWLKCMWGKAPTSIITDQDPAMKNAIEAVFPITHHRYCSWHIGNNAMVHLKALKLKYSEFEKEYNQWIYGCTTVQEFEEKWKVLKCKYNLELNSWLLSMFKDKNHWVPLYMKDMFFAGMTSSQRSESINSFFDGYVHAHTPLTEFVLQYDRALKSRRTSEEDEDFNTLNTRPVLHGSNPLEAQVGSLYTRKIFDIFQIEWKGSQGCMYKKIDQTDSSTNYEVFLYDDEAKKHLVSYQNGENISATCSCKKFESEGILCMHILRIFQKKQLTRLPEQYILHRWTINARYRSSRHREDSNNFDFGESKFTPLQLWKFRSITLQLQDLGTNSWEQYQYALPLLEEIVQNLEKMNNSKSQFSEEVEKNQGGMLMDHIPQIIVRDPSHLCTKGRPKKAQRLKAGYEDAKAPSKKRTCSLCHEKGHYFTTCKNTQAKRQD